MTDLYPDRKAVAAKNRAVVFSIVGCFLFAGIILGPLAIWQARIATARGVNARGWEILGWIGTVGAAVIIMYNMGVLQPH